MHTDRQAEEKTDQRQILPKWWSIDFVSSYACLDKLYRLESKNLLF